MIQSSFRSARAALWCVLLVSVPAACGKSDAKDADTKDAKKDAAANAGDKKAEDGKKKVAKASKKGAAAKKAKQKPGAKATASREKASAKGSTHDGLECDADLDGVAWCGSDFELVFCADGDWYVLDCSAVDEASFCGTSVEDMTVDCWVDDALAEIVEAAVLDAIVEDVVDEVVADAMDEAIAGDDDDHDDE
jgi:hypothetical protein